MIKLIHERHYVVTGPWGKTVGRWFSASGMQGWHLPGKEELFSVDDVRAVHRQVRV